MQIALLFLLYHNSQLHSPSAYSNPPTPPRFFDFYLMFHPPPPWLLGPPLLLGHSSSVYSGPKSKQNLEHPQIHPRIFSEVDKTKLKFTKTLSLLLGR